MLSIMIVCVGLAAGALTWAILASEKREQRKQSGGQ